MENQRAFLASVGKELGIVEGDFEAWYKVSSSKFGELGGHSLLKTHGYSMHKLLKAVYPEHDWLPWKSLQAPKFVLLDKDVVAKAVHIAESKLGITETNDWHRISMDQIKSIEEAKVFEHNGGIIPTLSRVYPCIDWVGARAPPEA